MSTNQTNTSPAPRIGGIKLFFIIFLAVFAATFTFANRQDIGAGIVRMFQASSYISEPTKSNAQKFKVLATHGPYHYLEPSNGKKYHANAPITASSPVPEKDHWYFLTPENDGTWYFMPTDPP